MLRARTTLVLLLATATGILLLHLFGIKPPPAPQTAVGSLSPLIPGGLANIDTLIIERSGQRLELGRNGPTWEIRQPFTAGADSITILKLLDALERSRIKDRFTTREMERRSLNLGDLGLSPPITRVVTRSPARRVELLFGTALPSTNEIYATSDLAVNSIVVIDREPLDAIPISLDRLRERTLWRESQGRVTAIEWRRPGMPFVKLIRNGDEWLMVQPATARANTKIVEHALEALRMARIERFVWPESTANGNSDNAAGIRTRLAYYGLDGDSGTQLQLWESGNPTGVRLRFGRPVEDVPGHIYMLTPGDASVVAVTNDVLDAISVTAGELRDKHVLPVAADTITQMSFQYSTTSFALERKVGNYWRFTTPVQSRADSNSVARLAYALANLQAERIMDTGPSTTSNENLCNVKISTADKEWQLTIMISTAEPETALITNSDSPSFYAIPFTNMPPVLLKSDIALNLIDLNILAIPSNIIRKISVRHANENIIAVQRASENSSWETQPDFEISLPAINAWLDLLAALRATRIERIGSFPLESDEYGLKDPWCEISVEIEAENALRKVLLIGKATADGNRYCMQRGHDVIFELSQATLKTLSQPLATAIPVTEP